MSLAMSRLVPLILVTLLAATASADRVVIVVGNSKGKELEALTAAAREATERASWTTVPHKLPPERVAEVIQCGVTSDGHCIGQLLDEVGADRLITLRLADEKYRDQPVRVVYGAILRRGAEVLAAGQRYCEGCRNDLLADHARSLVTDLVRDARRKINPATVVVRSVPPRAHVKIDGESVGPADSEFPVAAGAHILELTMKDYRSHSQEIAVADGQRLEIEAKLVSIHGEPVARPAVARPRDRRLGPWLAVGSGAMLMVAGGLFIAFDEDHVQHGTVVPDYRDTMTGGVVLAAAGAVVVTAGILWLTRAR
jgi:hypothetical protein